VSDLAELSKRIKLFVQERDWDQFHTPKNLATAIAVEAAELQEIFMWLNTEQSHQLTEVQKSHVSDELGDIMICLQNFASKLGLDPVTCALQKLEKVKLKYPVATSKGSADKYDQSGERS
jgi:dCTP diphosphatase